jgi:hypothetical protein
VSQKKLEVIARLRDEMSGNLGLIRSNIVRMGNVADATFSRMNRSLSLVRTALAAAAGGMLAKTALSEAASLERARQQLTALMGSEEQAAATLARIRDFAARSPLETGPVIEGFIQLEAVGVRAADSIIEKLGDVSVIFNRDLRDVVGAFVSAETEPLRRLGIEMDRTGKQAILMSGDIRKAVANNIPAIREGMLEIWEERFPNAMEAAASTFSAKMNVFRSNVGDTAADIGAVFLPKLKEMVDGANAWIEGHRAQIVAIAQSTGEILSLTGDFIVQKLNATIFSTEFWSQLPIQAERAFGETIDAFTRMLAVMAANWDIWIPTLVQSFNAAMTGMIGGVGIAFERTLAKVLKTDFGPALMFTPFTQESLDQASRLIESWIPAQEEAISSTVQTFLDSAVDNADAAMSLLDARIEAFRLRNGGQSLLDQGMSLISGAADDSGLTALLAASQAAIARNVAEAEKLKEQLAGVKREGGTAFTPLEEGADKASKKLKKVKTEAELIAEAIRKAFSEIDAVAGQGVDKMDALAALRRAQLDGVLGGGEGAGAQDAAAEALRSAERQKINAQMEVARQKLGVLDGQPGQEDAASAMLLDIQRMQVELRNLNTISENMKNPFTAMRAGMKEGLAQLEMTNQKWLEFASGSIQTVAQSLRSGIVDNIMEATKGMQSWGEAGKNALTGLLDSLQKVVLEMIALAAQQALLSAAKSSSGWVSTLLNVIGGAAGSKATGGVVPGGLTPIPRAATGAIFRGTQLAIVGDNPSRVEAAVPLPNGREIPVELKGGGAGGVSVNVAVYGADPRGIREMLIGETSTLKQIIVQALDESTSFRRQVRGTS